MANSAFNMQVEIKPQYAPTTLITKDWSQRRCFVRNCTPEYMKELQNFEVRDDDVWIITLPKCGTTWMQELVWLIMNNYDFEQAKQVPLELRSRFLEFSGTSLTNIEEHSFGKMNELPSPRILKSHLPLPLLPKQIWSKKPKVIYVYRHPIDALVSAYHFRKNFGVNTHKSLEEAVADTLNFEIETTSMFNHVLEFYELKNQPWLYYTSFELMKKDLRKVIVEICNFLNTAITEEQISTMLKHLSFDEMKNNRQVSHIYEFELVRKHRNFESQSSSFMRKGKVGGYKDELPAELIATLNTWIDNNLQPYNLNLHNLLY